ncbi:MAG: 16S rRNA pseudouridine(516) synthase RsuA [Motiliproteus sp.]
MANSKAGFSTSTSTATATAKVERMRLDRFLAQATGLSRSQLKPLIKRGAVCVDGQPLRDAAAKVGNDQAVLFRGEPVALRPPVYLMLNKPDGVICSTDDADHRTVIDLLPESLRSGVHPAGRLDLDTTGLVLLTDDGQWSHRITSPKRKCTKRYRVWLAEPLSPELAADAKQRFAEGLMLRGESQPTLPAELIVDQPDQVQILIQEGRYHQVKRMFAALGNKVVRLHREQIGALALDAALEPGQYRVLSDEEVALF